MHTSLSFSRRVALGAFISLLLIALVALVGYAAHFFFLVFGGLLVAVLLSALSRFVSRKTALSYTVSVGVVLLALLLLVGGVIMLLAPTVSRQTDQLAQTLPQAFGKLKAALMQSDLGRRLMEDIPQKPGKLFSSGGAGKGVLSQVTGVVSATLGGLVNVLIVLITGIYLAANPSLYRDGFIRLFSPGYRERLGQVLDQCYDVLKNWFISRSITMVIVGVVTGLGLTLLGIPFPIVLGILAGVLNFIPNLGPYLALAPALLVAFAQGPQQALYVFLLYMGLQSLEGYVLTPLLDKRFISTPPALLLFGQVLLGILVGLTGILFASPLIAVSLVLIRELYVKDQVENHGKPT